MLGDFWPLFEVFEDKLAGPRQNLEEVMVPILQDAVRKTRAAEKDTECASLREHEDNFLDDLVRQTSSFDVLKEEILTILLAGTCRSLSPAKVHDIRLIITDSSGFSTSRTACVLSILMFVLILRVLRP